MGSYFTRCSAPHHKRQSIILERLNLERVGGVFVVVVVAKRLRAKLEKPDQVCSGWLRAALCASSRAREAPSVELRRRKTLRCSHENALQPCEPCALHT
jgi:hypothetical protein